MIFFLLIPFFLFAEWQQELVEKIQQQRFPSWMTAQIEADLAPFHEGITPQLLEETISEYNARKSSLLVRYDLVNQKIFAEAEEETKKTDRFEAVTKALEELAELVYLPKVTLIISLHDSFEADQFNKPLIVFSKKKNDTHILMPDCYSLGDLEPFLSQANNGSRAFPWKKKIEKAFWRGGTNGHGLYKELPRYKLVKLSKERPDLIDAKLTGCLGCDEKVRKKLKKYMGGVKPIFDHIQYKYQILVDGYSASWTRAIWQLFSNSVILKQESPYIQWFYSALVPYVHYIPVASDFSDLVSKIEWAKKNDKKVHQIMLNEQTFAAYNLRKSDRYLYLYLLIVQLAQLSHF